MKPGLDWAYTDRAARQTSTDAEHSDVAALLRVSTDIWILSYALIGVVVMALRGSYFIVVGIGARWIVLVWFSGFCGKISVGEALPKVVELCAGVVAPSPGAHPW